MAALRTVLADHILTVPQRFAENTHKQDWILSLLVVGGSFFSSFFGFFFSEKKFYHIKQQCHSFSSLPVQTCCACISQGDLQISWVSFISSTGYFYSFFTSIPTQDNHMETYPDEDMVKTVRSDSDEFLVSSRLDISVTTARPVLASVPFSKRGVAGGQQ